MELSEALRKLLRQNETIISLLGRVAFKKDDVMEIVTRSKQSPEKYIQGYNGCDGNHTVKEIAAIVGVKPPTLSPILQAWEELGVIYEVEKAKGRFYKKLFPI